MIIKYVDRKLIELGLIVTLAMASPSLFSQPELRDFRNFQNFYWRQFENENQIRFELWSFKGEPSKIYFVWDKLNEEFITHETQDRRFNLIVPGPYQTPYYPHPQQNGVSSLEEEYLKILKRYQVVDDAFILPKIHNQNFETELEKIDISTSLPSLKEIAEQIRTEIKRTEDWALREFGLRANLPGRNWLSDFNPVEAIYSVESGMKIRLDAFNLTPIESLIEYGDQLPQALEDLSLQPDRYPLEWFVSSFEFSIRSRLSVLMLITHNHLAEDRFIYACISRYGILRAWEIFQNLNKIYLNERIFWLKNAGKSSTKISDTADQHVTALEGVNEVDVSPRRRVLAPAYGIESLGENAKAEPLAFVQLYHYYGAFILTHILLEEKNLSPSLASQAVKAFGLSYKLKTAGYQRDQIKKILKFYSKGTEHYLFLREFIR